MPDLHLPKPTTANERLWGKDVPAYWGQDVSLVRRLREHGWLVPEDEKFVYQPLFGLTAKDTKGKVRTVVEGDIVFPLDFDLPRIIRYKNFVWCASVIVPFNGPIDNDLRAIHLDIRMGTILCHATDIVAAGNKLTCWSCEGTGEAPKQCGEGTGLMMSKCPTCHGEGQHKIVWKD